MVSERWPSRGNLQGLWAHVQEGIADRTANHSGREEILDLEVFRANGNCTAMGGVGSV